MSAPKRKKRVGFASVKISSPSSNSSKNVHLTYKNPLRQSNKVEQKVKSPSPPPSDAKDKKEDDDILNELDTMDFGALTSDLEVPTDALKNRGFGNYSIDFDALGGDINDLESIPSVFDNHKFDVSKLKEAPRPKKQVMAKVPTSSFSAAPLPGGAPMAAPPPRGAPMAAPMPGGAPMAAPLPGGAPMAAPLPGGAPMAAPMPSFSAPMPSATPMAAPMAAPMASAAPMAAPMPSAAPMAAPMPSRTANKDSNALKSAKLVSSFTGLKSDLNTMSPEELNQYKKEILDKKLVSSNEYSSILQQSQTRLSKQEIQLSDEQKQNISSAKNAFSSSSGAAPLLPLLPGQKTISNNIRPADYDIHADIAYDRNADSANKQQQSQQLNNAAKVSQFSGLQSTRKIIGTSKEEINANISKGKVTRFTGLEQSTRKIVTADKEEQRNLAESKLVRKQKSLFNNLGNKELKTRKSVKIDSSVNEAASAAKNVFKQMEKQNTLANVKKSRKSTKIKNRKSKKNVNNK